MLALYRQWRPTTFAEVRGQPVPVRILQNCLRQNKLPQSLLLSGSYGSGKTTVARLTAKAANCTDIYDAEPCNTCASCLAMNAGTNNDVVEIDAASNGRVDDVRKLVDDLAIAPQISKYVVYILDEVHQLSRDAFDALLKALEEPPAHVLFMLATTEVDKIPKTVASRCMRLDFRPIPLVEIKASLEQIALAEGIAIETEAIQDLATTANGSLRDAQSLLEQAMRLSPEGITAASVRRMLGLAGQTFTAALGHAVAVQDRSQILTLLGQAAAGGLSSESVGRALTSRLRAMLYVQLGLAKPNPANPASAALAADAARTTAERLQTALHLLAEGWEDLRTAEDREAMLEIKTLSASYALGNG